MTALQFNVARFGIRHRGFMKGLERFRLDCTVDPGRFASGTALRLLAMARHVASPRLVPQANRLGLAESRQAESALASMNGISRTASIQVELEAGSIIVLPDELDVEVSCKSGLLWVAQLDNPNDLAIVAGGSMVIAKGKRSIVNAIDPASLEIHIAAHKHSRLIWKLSRNCHEIRYTVAVLV